VKESLANISSPLSTFCEHRKAEKSKVFEHSHSHSLTPQRFQENVHGASVVQRYSAVAFHTLHNGRFSAEKV